MTRVNKNYASVLVPWRFCAPVLVTWLFCAPILVPWRFYAMST